MIKRVKSMTITARLLISFALIMSIFIFGIVQSTFTTIYVNDLHRQNLEFSVARAEYTLDIHRELLQLRRDFRATFANPWWRGTASQEVWQMYEDGATALHTRMKELAQLYIQSVVNDPWVESKYSYEDIRILLMLEAMDVIGTIYNILEEEFFRGGDPGFDDTYISYFTLQAEELLHEIRQLALEDRNNILTGINATVENEIMLSAILVTLGISLSLLIAYLAIASFKNNLRNMEKQIALVEKGDFITSLKTSENDELSTVFAKLTDVFTKLIGEINKVSDEVRNDNISGRIDEGSFQGSYKDAALAINTLLDTVAAQRWSLEMSKEREFEAAERARIIFEAAPIIIEFWNKDFDCVDTNPYSWNLYGMASKNEYMSSVCNYFPEFQPCGTPSLELWHGKLKQIEEESGKYVSFPFVCGKPDGELLHTEVIGICEQVNDERLIITYSTDKTELIRSRQEAKSAMERAQLIFDHAPSAISYWNRENTQVIDCNNYFANMFGFDISDKEKVLSKFFQGFTPAVQPCGTPSEQMAAAYIQKIYESGEPYKFEWIHNDLTGSPLPAEITLVPLNDQAFASYARDLREEIAMADKLNEANVRAKMIFDHAPIGISYWSEDLTIHDCNYKFMDMLGVKAEDKAQLLREYPEGYLPEFQPCGTPSDVYMMRNALKAIETGAHSFDMLCLDVHGNDLPIEIIGASVKVGERYAFLVYSRDQRKEKAVAAKLSDANSRAKIFFDKAPLAITFWSGEKEPLDCNEALVQLFAVNNKIEYLDNFFSFSPMYQPCGAPSKKKALEYFDEAARKGMVIFEWMHIDAKGELLPCVLTLLYVKLHDDHAYIAYFQDQREALLNQKKIREANDRVQLMLDSTPVACFLINKDYVAIDCNMEAVNLFNLSEKEECIKSFKWISRCINCPESFLECRRTNKKCSVEGTPSMLEEHFNKAMKDGHSKVELNLKALDGSGAIPCEINFARLAYQDDFVVAAYIIDLRTIKKMIEDMHKLETAEENSIAKSKFLARMSHEIRTPITAVLGISEIQLQNPGLSLETEEAFAKIYDSAEGLLSIINDILDISKIEAGKMELILDIYDVPSIIVDTIQIHLVHLGSKKIEFTIDADENMPAFLIGDELRIKQILNNILSNAFKYTDEGCVSLGVSCEYIDGHDDEGSVVNLKITITDTGKGMTENQIAALSDEYTRFHEKESRFTQGTGLGMPIVYNLVELMNGWIGIESEVGKGTAVTVILPQKIAAKEKLGPQTANNLRELEQSILLSSHKKKIDFDVESMPYGSVLVVDDVETNLYVAKGLMSFYDLKIDTAVCGSEVVEKVKSGAVYDIIFMDHMMPGMSGIEATKIIRSLGYTEPVVAFTANALIGQAEEFMKNGFDSFISKPIQAVHLNSILNKFIRDKQPPHVLEAAREKAKEAKRNNSAVNSVNKTMVDSFYNDPVIANTIRKDFLRTQKKIISQIMDAVNEEDLKTAHRLAHTLKGMAGLIGETALLEISQKIENAFKNGEVPTELLDMLAQEMEQVFNKIYEQYKDELSVKQDTPEFSDLDKEKAAELFDSLAGLLEQKRGTAIDLLDELARVPQTEELISQIEDFDFAIALETLKRLRKTLEL